ncbi:MAG: hypothetical protein EPO10_21425 [Reyranella sp.]|uniref:hypothetical protein n=1 Tax=Reyranella sp. TaxID=1929291 RepID=UPI001205FDA2|nr:hypothetical protein [Reyranella sp.]TAJ97696.1 MAG: hypothetical protein EPO41_02315 [Reyranella sp.]TBR26793.1 MAG: hypothetical protein EPO10_21425 [Reyranella sp.]
MLIKRLAPLVLVALMPLAAAAQQNVEVKFRFKENPNSISGCIQLDPSFTREHTFTIVNGQVELKSAGGIDVKMKSIRANVYEGRFDLGRMNIIYTADLGATPPTLVAQSQDGGCKWNAVKV